MLQNNRSGPSIHSEENISPQQVPEAQQQEARRGSECTSSCSQITNAEDGVMTLAVPDNAVYLSEQNGQPYPRSMPTLSSPHAVSAHSQYEAPIGQLSSLKRKRSCFEIRDDSVADFIDKGLITVECAVSCFNTCVSLSSTSRN